MPDQTGPPPPLPAAGVPPSLLVDRFVVTATSDALFLRIDSLALAGPGGALAPVPAFSGVLSPANAQALGAALQEAARASLTLNANTDNPQ